MKPLLPKKDKRAEPAKERTKESGRHEPARRKKRSEESRKREGEVTREGRKATP